MRSSRWVWLSTLALLVSASVSVPVTHAAEFRQDSKGYAGAMLGLSSVDNGVGTGLGFGLDAGFFLNDSWGVGAFLKSANHDHDVTQFTYAAEGIYRVAMFPGLSAGAMLGASKFSQGDAPNNGFNITFGLKAAYDFPVSTSYPITVGADLAVNWVKPADTMLTVFTPFLTAKWWF